MFFFNECILNQFEKRSMTDTTHILNYFENIFTNLNLKIFKDQPNSQYMNLGHNLWGRDL